jgi:hypothetical protein
MTQDAASNPAAGAFAQHIREFHRGLPNEEKQLLEQVFALAEAATSMLSTEGEEARGYAYDAFLKLSQSASKIESGSPFAYKEHGAAKIVTPLQGVFAQKLFMGWD